MKKQSLTLLISLALFQFTFAQNKWANYSQTYPSSFNKDSTRVGIIANIEERNNDFWSITNNDELEKSVLENPNFKKAPLDNFIFKTTFSHTPVYFFIKNINSQNADDYEYRVSEDGHKVIVPWSVITEFNKPGFGAGEGRIGEMGYIGGYTANPGHQIVVDLRRKGTEALISTAVILWILVKPVIKTVFTANDLNLFLNYLTHPWINRDDRSFADKNGKLTFKSTENSLIFCLQASISSKKQIEYEVIKDNKLYISWRSNDFDNAIIWLKNLPHGNYQLKFRYTIQPEHTRSLDFVIKPAWYQTAAIKIVAGSLLAAFLGLIATVIYLILQKRKAIKEIAKKNQLQLELQSIRSQLNPHFIFNALTSIQGLINKHDDLGANNYLTEFAQLLRNTLVNNNQEQIPLSVEIKNLETYLKLEQLRFNFNYEINVDEGINTYENDIPSLILQPLLENAIKHGIADLGQAGKLTLDINRMNVQDMMIKITDNGKGFNEQEVVTGFGLKLTKDRINLYNKISDHQQIELEVYTEKDIFTSITLTFKNWLNGN